MVQTALAKQLCMQYNRQAPQNGARQHHSCNTNIGINKNKNAKHANLHFKQTASSCKAVARVLEVQNQGILPCQPLQANWHHRTRGTACAQLPTQPVPGANSVHGASNTTACTIPA